MSDLDALTVRAIAESAAAAATLAGIGDTAAAKAALERAAQRFELFSSGRPGHSRNVRLAREALAKARRSVDAAAGNVLTKREKHAVVSAATRAAERAKA